MATSRFGHLTPPRPPDRHFANWRTYAAGSRRDVVAGRRESDVAGDRVREALADARDAFEFARPTAGDEFCDLALQPQNCDRRGAKRADAVEVALGAREFRRGVAELLGDFL